MDKFVINNNLKPSQDLKIEPRVLNFDQMNKTLGLDMNKKNPVKSNTKPSDPNKSNNNSIDNRKDSYDNILSDSVCLDDLKSRLKAFQDRDFKADLDELMNLGLHAEEILPGEYINERYDAEVLIQGLKCNGLIVLTNYRLMIMPINEKFLRCLKLKTEFLEIPYMYIEKLNRTLDKKQNPPLALFELYTKDCREIKLKFIMDEELTLQSQESIYLYLLSSISPSFIEMYALQISRYWKKLDVEHQGWDLYSIEKEYQRQGIKIYEGVLEVEAKVYQYRYLENTQGKVCSTYPSKLVVPMRLLDDFIIRSANFRSRERLPVLSYCYTYQSNNKTSKKVGLWRSSQCKPGLTANRCLEDEALIRVIGGDRGEESGGGFAVVRVYDARPYLNAVANKFNGKGYEDITSYKNVELKFLGIPNIQKVRDAYRKIRGGTAADNEKGFDFMPWFDCIAKILAGAGEIVQSLKEGNNTLIHCSDGWDRTSQLAALVELIMDPYFRSIEGFFVLIEKEWIAFGHQFALRSGHARNNVEDQKSPVFVQFLDCVHQLYYQYPLSFEFTPKLLNDIANHLYSCYFGTFLMDSGLEREKCKFQESTVSLWSYLLSNKQKYKNPNYKSHKELDLKETIPMASIKLIRLWKEHFMQFSLEAEDPYKLYEGTQFPEDNLLIEHQNLIRENIVLKKSTNDMLSELEQCKATLKRYEEKFGNI